MSNLDVCFAFTIGSEGGYTANPNDPGNWTGGSIGSGTLKGTKYGISAAQYPNVDIQNLTLQGAEELYVPDYWNPIQGDNLPLPVAMVAFDAAVNSGVGRSIQWLQAAAGAYQDGVLGPNTLAAIQNANVQTLVNEALSQRMLFLSNLSSFSNFGLGWTRRVIKLRACAIDPSLINTIAL